METYDDATGQVYVETSVPIRSMVPTWMNESTGKRKDPRTCRSSGTGAASLQDMTRRSCIWDIESFTPETFAEVPWHLAAKIYNRMKQTDTLTLSSWTLFKARYPAEVDTNFSQSVPEKAGWPSQLPSIATYMLNIPFTCLTLLSIDNLDLSTNPLMLLLNISSLATLDLNSRNRSDHRTLRNWIRAAREKQALPNLQVLLLRCFSLGSLGRRVDLEDTLMALAAFPGLAIVNIYAKFSDPAIRYLHLPPGEQTFCEGRWKRLTGQGEDSPERVWEDPNVTTREKLHALYQLAQNTTAIPADQAASTPTLSLHYAYTYRPKTTSLSTPFASVWFAPEPKEEEEVHQQGTSQEKEQQTHPPNKKRKVREGKQKDLSSMLGIFN